MILKLFFIFIWCVFQLYIGFYLLMPLMLFFIYSLSKKNNHSPLIPHSSTSCDYAIIVTAYEQTDLLMAAVTSLLKLNYNNYLVYVVADNCDITHLNFDDERVILLRPEQILASNTRSHFYAIEHFLRPHQRLTIIDSDNLVHPEYINELNVLFNQGYQAVQGLREPKNLNSTYAKLDAARDIFYHFYDGEVLFNVGSSATLSGSGMAFSVDLYKECLEHLDITGAGFDKVLQKQIVEKNIRIAFAKKAIVYDEKTAHSDQLVKQRARWINTWFKYFKYGFEIFYKGLFEFKWNQILFGLVLLRPPLFLLLLLSLVIITIHLFINPFMAIVWGVAILLFIIGFFIALLLNNTSTSIYKSLLGIPKFIFYQMLSLAKVRNANKHSIATKHRSNTIP